MKALTQSVLAAAMLMALPFAAAEACTNNAWNGNTSAAAAGTAAGPAASQPRYKGLCSYQAATSNAFVTDDTPNAEATFQVRFSVFTGGSGKVFSATTENGNAGTEVIGVSYNGTAFTFSGATGVSPIPAASGRWHTLVLTHVSGQPFSVAVQGAGATTPTTGTGTSATATVGSASVGFIGTATGVTRIDEYESTRSTTPIPFLCRGDANNDGTRNVVDVIQVRNEAAAPTVSLTQGTPDFNEDGQVNVVDVIQIRNQAAAAPACS